jgi:hypothetical protein
LWSHNDSGQPVLYALDARGAVTTRLRLTGARVEDWEAVAVGPCPSGSCLFVADIGDNDAARQQITVYRVPEPAGAAETLNVTDVFHATYPDGPHDAETLLVAPDGALFIVTKGDTGPVRLYRFPQGLKTGTTVRLEVVGKPLNEGKAADARITDGTLSPDGTWMLLRTKFRMSFFRTADVVAGNWREVRGVDLKPLGEPQGEGIALAADSTVYVAGEGGGKGQAGTFAHFPCTPES